MISQKILEAWKRWVQLGVELPVKLRGNESVKVYPGVYIDDENSSRKEINGIRDGNVFLVEWKTKLVSTPGEDSQVATTAASHDALQYIVSDQLNNCNAHEWINSQIGIRVFELLVDPPETVEVNGYRVTTWQCNAICCSI